MNHSQIQFKGSDHYARWLSSKFGGLCPRHALCRRQRKRQLSGKIEMLKTFRSISLYIREDPKPKLKTFQWPQSGRQWGSPGCGWSSRRACQSRRIGELWPGGTLDFSISNLYFLGKCIWYLHWYGSLHGLGQWNNNEHGRHAGLWFHPARNRIWRLVQIPQNYDTFNLDS